jgi:transcriptional regulator with XRE-family HTH domain
MNHTHKLLDHISMLTQAKNDAALARALGLSSPVISKMRHGKSPVSSSFIIRVMEATDMTLDEIHALAGIAKHVPRR